MKELLRAVIDQADPVAGSQVIRPARAPVATNTPPTEGKLTQGEYWAAIQEFIRTGDVLVAEDSTANAGAWQLALPAGSAATGSAVPSRSGW